MNEYTRVLAANRHANEQYKSSVTLAELNAQLKLEYFRSLANVIYADTTEQKKKLDTEIAKINADYSKQKAGQLILIAKEGYNDYCEINRTFLRQKLEEIISAKTEQLTRHILETPKPEQMTLLQAVSMRKEITPTEFEMLVSKCITNHQALAILHDIAAEKGYKFSMPYDPETYITSLAEINEILSRAINDLGTDSMNYRSHELYESTPETSPNGYLTSKFAMLDFDIATAVKLPELTLKEKLEQFIEKSKGEGNYKKAMLADDFYKSHEEELLTPEEKRNELETGVNEIVSDPVGEE